MNTKTRALVVGLLLALVSFVLTVPSAEAAISRTVSIKSTPKAALKTTKVTFSGVLTKSPKGSTVKVQRKSGTTWINVKATTTTKAGAWSVQVALPATAGNYRFRSFAPAKPGLKAATSSAITVTALRRTTFFKVGGTFDFLMQSTGSGQPGALAGSLNPIYTAGAVVAAQRKIGAGPWTTIGTSTIASNGTFQVAFPNAQSGQYRVLVSRKGLNASALSQSRSFVFV